VTQAAPFDPAHRPASAIAATTWATEDAMPKITLFGTAPGAGHALEWDPERDLLDAGPTTRAFVVEVESDGTARIRFGDDVFGLRPSAGTSFDAVYRVGNGRAGNVGAGALAHIVLDGPSPIIGVTNPLPATGGVDPEDSERVRQNAPAAFRTQRRAVTLEDYSDVTERKPGIQRAAASVRWTGSWPTVFVTVDRLGGQRVDESFREEIVRYLDGYRMAGQDVDVDGPQFASLDVELFVCVRPDFFRTDVEQQLRQVFSSGTLPDGRRGFFHPDNFTFGQPVWLSGIYAAAQAVAGVQSVEVTKFQRQGDDESDARDSGVLRLARLEIARLEQNPDFPEHGKLAIQLGGGK
jgi:predicted phage baseplate assembly protein